MKIEELNKVTKYFRDRGYRRDFTGKKGHELFNSSIEDYREWINEEWT